MEHAARFGLVSVVLVAQSVAAQVTFRSDVNLVPIAVRVTDSRGHDVRGLTKQDFTVLEDGKQREIAVFSAEEQPVTLAVLLDKSSSMRAADRLDRVRTAAEWLMRATVPGTQLLAAEFSGDSEGFREVRAGASHKWTSGTGEEENAGTALYDSLSLALCRLHRARHPRQVLVVVTDGADQHSRLHLTDVIAAARSSLAQVFVVGCFGRAEYEMYRNAGERIALISGSEIDNPVYAFRHLAAETGAEAFYATTDEEIHRAFEKIRENLGAQYTVGYYLKSTGDGYRRIQVELKRRGLRARARRGVSSTISSGAESACVISPREHPYSYEARLRTTEGGNRIYTEDFADESSGWPKRGGAFYRAGGYHIVRPIPTDDAVQAAASGQNALSATFLRSKSLAGWARGDATLVGYGPWWKQCRASVTVELPVKTSGARTTAPSAGLAFRINDLGYYAVLTSADGRWFKLTRQAFHLGGRDLSQWTSVPLEAMRAGPMTIAVESRGTKLTIVLNGKPVASYDDQPLDGGMIGMVLLGDGHAVFRKLVAEEF